MRPRIAIAGVVGALGLALGCEPEAPPSELRAQVEAMDRQLTEDLERVAGARVFFAHMSVGANVLDGLARISDSGLRLVARKRDETAELPERSFSHQLFGQNGDPDAKLRAFERLLNEQLRPSPDVALMKLCYADVGPGTDGAALAERYLAMLERLRRAHPETRFVHVTSPLTVRDAAAKDLVKRLSGLSDGFAQSNVRRAEYNARLRAALRGEPIFDLAEVESHWPDGRAESFTRSGERFPSLVPAYSNDGHHLAAAGQDRAARALVHAVADALRR